MSYQPQPGDVLLVYAPTAISAAIDTVEALGLLREHKKPPDHTPLYSHAAVYVGPDPRADTGVSYVVEALGRGVTRGIAAKWEDVSDVWSMPLTDAQRQEVVMRANAFWRSHWRYSFGDIAIQAVIQLSGLRLPWAFRHSVICSVLAYDCYKAAQVSIASHRNCAPEDIAVYGALTYRGQFGGATH